MLVTFQVCRSLLSPTVMKVSTEFTSLNNQTATTVKFYDKQPDNWSNKGQQSAPVVASSPVLRHPNNSATAPARSTSRSGNNSSSWFSIFSPSSSPAVATAEKSHVLCVD
eukprot:Filipodium_phascolosomae@DN436_c0_g1_i2.p1